MNRKRFISACLSVGMALSLGACGDTGSGDVDPAPLGTAGMALNVDIIGGSDVAGFRFDVQQVDCDDPGTAIGASQSADESLKNMMLPGGNDTFEYANYDPDSEHVFADHFFNVSPGCYDITATPIALDGTDSDDCATATLDNQLVLDEAFNEFHLVSQCRGVARTALDVIGSLNHPPEVSLEIDKFMCAGGGVVACATASDPDGDPVEFSWDGLSNACYSPEVISSEYDEETGEWTECVVIPSSDAESLSYKVTARDMAWENGCMVPIEDILPEQSGVDFDANASQASIYFDTHALDDCIAGGMAFIGVTLGADLTEVAGDLVTNTTFGMSEAQANQLADNAVKHVNPNRLGDPDPRILLVHDMVNSEDMLEGRYIKERLEAAGYSKVTLIQEPAAGLTVSDTISYSVIWFLNPGHPNDKDGSYDTLLTFREQGGGLIMSGDDANQDVDLTSPRTIEVFSFMEFNTGATNDNPNGTHSCGYLTNDNMGESYRVVFAPVSPLSVGLAGASFPYGNDIDRNIALNAGETVGATTRGLQMPGKRRCLGENVPVMTSVPAGTVLP